MRDDNDIRAVIAALRREADSCRRSATKNEADGHGVSADASTDMADEAELIAAALGWCLGGEAPENYGDIFSHGSPSRN